MIPTLGRIVAYKLTAYDAEAINKRRADLHASGFAQQNTGGQCHIGNSVAAGDVYPMVITRVWSTMPGGAVNGQVLLDGNDTFWSCSRSMMVDEETGQPLEGSWALFPRVEG